MSYVSPDRVFAFLVDSYGTVAVFVYLLIACAQLRLRARLEAASPERLKVRMWGYPWLSRLSILAMLAILGAMAFMDSMRLPLLFGVASAALMLLAYVLRKAFRPGGRR
jgi:GABA permease